jgi:hypothetical protein
MSQQELLKRVVEVLEAAGVEYMATGSIVSSAQGEPRATHDIDLVVVLTPTGADQLARAFPMPDFYLDPVTVKEAIQRKDMFNLLDITGGDKVDFWTLRDDPFDQSSFSRKYAEDVGGIRLFMSRPEDTILQKLRWSEMSGGSEKQFRDALRVYEVQYRVLDLAYMEQWAAKLDVGTIWERLKTEAVVA